ncbi:FAD-dependent oxidoreductase [Streptomyces sp. NPDC051976]|uniref:NAD(P)/FAD-dependent oxidoreductase n=1 Tax=Streptomyces sp. NPDC051976 TaxID=3154947 RepID=UPI003442D72C
MTEQKETSAPVSHQDGERTYDVVVVGGGAAGLSGALTLARSRRSVLVVDAGEPRNAPASHIHNYLGREAAPPAALLADGRAEVRGYGGEFATARVTTAVRRPGGGFRLTLDDGSAVLAARLLLATGLVDGLPPVPGLAERWGREVLHCPYCHGWEVRDQPVGVLATGPLAVHQALLWRQWTEDVTVFAHTAPAFGEEAYEQFAARGIAVVEGEVTGLRVAGDRLTGVVLDGGRVVPRAALVVATHLTARLGGLEGLGLTTAEQEMAGVVVGEHLPTDAWGATAVPGVWAAGNVTALADTVLGAAAAGGRAGAAINGDLMAEDTRRAVAARAVAAR